MTPATAPIDVFGGAPPMLCWGFERLVRTAAAAIRVSGTADSLRAARRSIGRVTVDVLMVDADEDHESTGLGQAADRVPVLLRHQAPAGRCSSGCSSSSRAASARSLLLRMGAALLAAVASPAWSQSYTAVDLGTLSEGTAAVVRGPNLAGTAFGGGRLVLPGRGASLREGLVFERGATRALEAPEGSDYTNALGGNDVGAVVGAANSASAVRAFARARDGSIRELPPLPGDTASSAYAVNNAGQSAGWSSGPGGERAVTWSAAGLPAVLPVADGRPARAYDINAQGVAVGVVGTSTGRRASLWLTGAAATELAPLQGFVASEATALNARGDVVGYSATQAEMRRATRWPSSGPPVDLGVLDGGNWSQALGLNDAGTVVGTSTSAAGMRAVLWQGGGRVQDLNGLVALAGVVLTKAVGINSAGMIVALGHEAPADGHEHSHDHEQPIRVVLLVPAGG